MAGTEIARAPQNVATVKKFFEQNIGFLQRVAVPGTDQRSLEQVLNIFYAAVGRNPKLLQCSQKSLFKCIGNALSLGLTLNGPLAEAYAIPYKTEAEFQLGYQGARKIARDSGEVKAMDAYLVYPKDEFEVLAGTAPKIHHKLYLGADRGEWTHAYGTATMRDGTIQFSPVLTREEIYKHHRDRSQAWRYYKTGKSSEPPPWVTDEEEMVRKTMVLVMFKSVPRGTLMTKAAAIEQEGYQALAEVGAYEILEDEPATGAEPTKSKAEAIAGDIEKKKRQPKPKEEPPPTPPAEEEPPLDLDDVKLPEREAKADPVNISISQGDDSDFKSAQDVIRRASTFLRPGDWNLMRSDFQRAWSAKWNECEDVPALEGLFNRIAEKLKEQGVAKETLEQAGIYIY